MVEFLAMVIGLLVGGFGVWMLKRKAPEVPDLPKTHSPNIGKVSEIDAEIPYSSGSSSVDELISWADRGRARKPNDDAK